MRTNNSTLLPTTVTTTTIYPTTPVTATAPVTTKGDYFYRELYFTQFFLLIKTKIYRGILLTRKYRAKLSTDCSKSNYTTCRIFKQNVISVYSFINFRMEFHEMDFNEISA